MSQTNQTSPKVGQLEKKTQERIVKLFQEKLGYTYLGNWEDRENNSNIEEELLKEYLQSTKKYSQTIIDKVVYELNTPGVQSVEDIFISKLESGYEVKALGSKKVYVNSIPVNLPISKYSILDNKLFVEFNSAFRQDF